MVHQTKYYESEIEVAERFPREEPRFINEFVSEHQNETDDHETVEMGVSDLVAKEKHARQDGQRCVQAAQQQVQISHSPEPILGK